MSDSSESFDIEESAALAVKYLLPGDGMIISIITTTQNAHGGWISSNVAERYLYSSLGYEFHVGKKILDNEEEVNVNKVISFYFHKDLFWNFIHEL
jgi:hypothetical protein